MKLNKFKRLLMLLWSLTMTCSAYADGRTDITNCFDGMHVEMRNGWIGNNVYVELESFDGRTAYCKVEFKNGPERRIRKATLRPDESRTITFSPSREIIRMKITVRCAESNDRLKNKSAVDDSCRSGPIQLSLAVSNRIARL